MHDVRFFLQPAGELAFRVFDAEGIGGAAAGVDAGGDEDAFVRDLAAAVLW
jgi:hypothetical protein